MAAMTPEDLGRIIRTDRCHCGEHPQGYVHTGRGASWFACTCGRIGAEAMTADKAVYNWNQAVRRG